MIAGCPKCNARYRVDAGRIGPDGAKLRCTKCSAVFLVRAPKAAADEPPIATPPAPASPTSEQAQTSGTSAASAPARTSAAPAAAATADSEPKRPVDRARLVIVADPDESRGKATAEAIRGWGLEPFVVHDGVEAMLSIQRMLPAAVVLDAALPKMFGFQVCEIVKRNESLRQISVVLVGAIQQRDGVRRDPADLYGADVCIEQPDLPDALKAIFAQAGLPIEEAEADPTPTATAPRPPEARPSPQPKLASTPAPVAAPTAKAAPVAKAEPEAKSDEDPERTAERERAQRLARIAVSEMLLYSPEKFENAVVAGNLEQVLDLEIQEARALLRQRISEEVRAETDFILDELHRVAADRGGQG